MKFDFRYGVPAEGACRHLVNDRIEQTGMYWIFEGAQRMLHFRAVPQPRLEQHCGTPHPTTIDALSTYLGGLDA